MESLYESWAKRNPSWERRYQSTVVDVFCDYGKGVSSFLEARGKIFGAGYEIFIIAFFIGLYHNRTKPLIEDRDKKKVFGQAIQYWGNIENRIGRTSYGNIRRFDYIEDKLANDPNYYFSDVAFLTEITNMLVASKTTESDNDLDDELPESLD